ncbi:hypothetical protein Taro_004443 [Colocasia esculenta]|uniref:Carboxypeptidase n=1 Tax=Colocasia esculenta TaxID=4460 RepID=A0A843TRM8_COLES|nr:hypothetical protein [Colocasia esculenta]
MAGGELGNMDFLLSVFPLLLFVFPAASPLLPTAAAASAPVKAPLFPKDAIPTQSGYLPVNATSSSAMYFAYHEAQQPRQPLPKTPLLVWLQGGPGCSSLLGNFFELGPWLVVNSTAGVALARNPYSWNRLFGLLFLDNPLGSGFSVAADPSEIPRDQEAVAVHLWTALQAFLSSDPSFRSRPLYITGESYAGKYIPSVGYYILRQNSRVSAARRINLLGVAIGSGLTHPVAQVVTHADGVYFTGLINERQKAQLEQIQSAAQKLALAGKWAAASDARITMVEWLENATGLVTLYDLSKTKPYESGLVRTLLREEEAKAALGVDRRAAEWEICSKKVAKVLHADVMKSAKGEVEGLLGKVRVLLYQGLYDLMEGGVSTAAWLRELQWEGLEGFLAAERRVWRLGAAGERGGRLAGYVQSVRWLSEVVVAGAGHLVPADQGQSAQVMIESWVLEEDPFGGHQDDANRTGGDLLKSH